MLYGDVGGPYVVDDDWLVREDILVFGGHSTLGEGEGMGGCVGELMVKYSGSPLREQRRVSGCWWLVFLKSASNHDSQTSFDISQLYPPPPLHLLNLFGAVLFRDLRNIAHTHARFDCWQLPTTAAAPNKWEATSFCKCGYLTACLSTDRLRKVTCCCDVYSFFIFSRLI
jgi:hypothetical protein